MVEDCRCAIVEYTTSEQAATAAVPLQHFSLAPGYKIQVSCLRAKIP